MLTDQQRRRHNKRFTKAFGRCRIIWEKDRAYVRTTKPEYNGITFWLYRKGWNWVVERPTDQFMIQNPNLEPLAHQLRLMALIGG